MYSFTCVCLILGILSGHYGSASRIQNDTRLGLYRQRRQTDCDGFKCLTSGDCIDDDKYCDGHVDCIDGSDETNRCKNLGCPGYLFRCKYGACISPLLECNGKKDCKDGSDESSTKCTRNVPKCRDTQFRCKSGQCISEDYKCDGKADCPDGSDESLETCSGFPCPGYTYKCAYGACISILGLCNGTTECVDGSDEDPSVCRDRGGTVTPVTPVTRPPPVVPVTPRLGKRPPPVTSPGNCVLPSKVQNGNWSIWGGTGEYDYQPGDRVIAGTLLQVQCRKGFKVDGTTPVLFCKEGKWSPKVPQCAKSCHPAVAATSTTFVTCTYNNVQINCADAISGTTARFSCPRFFELSINNPILFCTDGSWEDTRPTCVPVCGEKNVRIKELAIGGHNVSRGSYPWVVALYKKDGDEFTHWCGGSLINQRVIVTAAHCVTDQKGNKLSEDLYRVAAGKYFRDYKNPNDTDAEFSEVEKIFVHDNYKALTLQYEGDIAVLVAKESFNSSQFIQRVCVDWDQNSFYESRLLGTNGTITGWGYTIRGAKPSEVLKELEVPYIDYAQCYTAMPEEFKKFVRTDKMCAGYLNQGIGVCEGDSGGGLVFQQQEGNRRYFLRGLVSVAPLIDDSCNENEYALYTKISSYIPFIATIERTYRRPK